MLQRPGGGFTLCERLGIPTQGVQGVRQALSDQRLETRGLLECESPPAKLFGFFRFTPFEGAPRQLKERPRLRPASD